MSKAKMGRPKMPKGEARDSVVTVRLTKAERRAAEAAAKKLGLAFSEWTRRTIVDSAQYLLA